MIGVASEEGREGERRAEEREVAAASREEGEGGAELGAGEEEDEEVDGAVEWGEESVVDLQLGAVVSQLGDEEVAPGEVAAPEDAEDGNDGAQTAEYPTHLDDVDLGGSSGRAAETTDEVEGEESEAVDEGGESGGEDEESFPELLVPGL